MACAQKSAKFGLVPETGYEHRGGPLAHGISGQGSERPDMTIDTVRSQASGGRAGGQDKLALRVQTEGAGDRFGGHLPDRSQTPRGLVYSKSAMLLWPRLPT